MSECDCDYLIVVDKVGKWDRHYGNCRLKWLAMQREKPFPKNPDGTIYLPNPYLHQLQVDVLYHLNLDNSNFDLPAMFGNVKFVCMGGTEERMLKFAKYISGVLKIPCQTDLNGEILNITKSSHRFAMFKVGPVLSISHGVGTASLGVLLQEVLKLLQYARAVNPVFLRIGTSGGLAVVPGSVVISRFGLNPTFSKTYDLVVLGQVRKLPANFDRRLSQELLSMAQPEDNFRTMLGGTMAAEDFYTVQGRRDGPFCDFNEEQRRSFLRELHMGGVRNIEMEATAFAALCSQAAVRAADLCVTLLDRFKGDQVVTEKAVMAEWQMRPMIIVGRYIKSYQSLQKFKDSLKKMGTSSSDGNIFPPHINRWPLTRHVSLM